MTSPEGSAPGGAARGHRVYVDAPVVEFTAADGGEGAMTWGQRAIWESIQWLDGEDAFFNGSTLIDLPETATLDGLLAAVRDVATEHQSLRSRYPIDERGPRQVVEREGQMGVGVIEALPAGATLDEDALEDARALADDVRGELAGFSFTNDEWPWRVAAVLVAGAPRYLALVASHRVIDGWSFNLLVDQLKAWTCDGKPESPPRSTQPLDQGAYEASEQALRRNEGSLRYWTQMCTRMTPSLFDRPVQTPEKPRFVKVAFRSQAVAAASRAIVDRLNLSSSVVLIAATSAMVAAVTGHSRVALSPIVANRFDAERRTLLAPLTEDGLFVLDVGACADFDALVRLAHRQALICYHYGYYDPVALAKAVRSVESGRGIHVDLSAYFNDTRLGHEWPAVASTRTDLEKLAVSTTLTPVGAWDAVDAKFFVTVVAEGDTCKLDVTVDTAYVPLATAEAALKAFEALLISAAFDVVPADAFLSLPGVPPVDRPDGWVRIGEGWVDVAACTDVLRAASGADARVVVEAGASDGEVTLVGYVPGLLEQDAADLHARLVASLTTRTAAMAPAWYVGTTGAPEHPESATGWAGLTAWRSDGRPTTVPADGSA